MHGRADEAYGRSVVHDASRRTVIEDLNLNPAVKKAIILLLHRTHIKVLKDAPAC